MEVHVEPDVLTDQINITVTLTVLDTYPYETTRLGGPQFYAFAFNESGKITKLGEYESDLDEFSHPTEGEESLRPGVYRYLFNWNGHVEQKSNWTEDGRLVQSPHGGDRVSPGEYTIDIHHKAISFLQENVTVEVMENTTGS